MTPIPSPGTRRVAKNRVPASTQPRQINWGYAAGIVLIHVLSLLIFLPWFFSWSGVLLFAAGHFVFGMLGMTLGYHRLLTHRSFRCPKWLEYFFAVLGVCSLQDTPARWVAVHRKHHQHSDEQPDPHSPLVTAIWGHFGWLMLENHDHNTMAFYEHYARDVLKDRFYLRLERGALSVWIYIAHAILFFAAGWAAGWLMTGQSAAGVLLGASWLVWGVLARTVYIWHVTWSVNSLTHLWGYRNYSTDDNSRNNWLVGLFANGEGWHNNHHADQSSAAHGHRWWELDLTYWTIRALEKVGLAKDVVQPRIGQRSVPCCATNRTPRRRLASAGFACQGKDAYVEGMQRNALPSRDQPANQINGAAFVSGLLMAVTLVTSVGFASEGSDCRPALYHADPDHLWNRIHSALMVRTGPDGKSYGHDRLEPLLWSESTYLLQGQQAEQAVAILEAFNQENGERLIESDIQRAMLQRDLWLISNWFSGVQHSNRRLEAALDQAIRRLALPAQQIAKLPDNYAAAVASRKYSDRFNPNKADAPYLPPDLFQEDGPWVCVSPADGPAAPQHLRDDGANRFNNSVFLIFLKLPGARQQTLEFLQQLAKLDSLIVPNTNEATSRIAPFLPHPQFPAWPKGTEVALVRRALLINSNLRIAASPLTESVQIRVVTTETPALTADVLEKAQSRRPPAEWQASFEFQLRRADFFNNVSGGLRDVSLERDFKTGFNSHPWDEFDRTATTGQTFIERSQPFKSNRASCTACHTYPGTLSFNSVPGFAFGGTFKADEGDIARRLPRPTTIADAEKNVIKWKEGRPAWKAFVKRHEQ